MEWGGDVAKVGLSVAGVHNITPILRKKQVARGAFVVILQHGHGAALPVGTAARSMILRLQTIIKIHYDADYYQYTPGARVCGPGRP